MSGSMRRVSMALLAVLATALAGASVAWACRSYNEGARPVVGSVKQAPTSTNGTTRAPGGSKRPSTVGRSAPRAVSSPRSYAGGRGQSSAGRSVGLNSTRGAQRSQADGRSSASRGDAASASVRGSAGSVARKASSARGSSARSEGRSEPSRRASQASARSASGDLWSGFRSAKTPSLMSQTGGLPAAKEGPDGSQLAIGAGLLGFGLLALLGGFGLAAARRRRPVYRATGEGHR